jgi:DNA helicase-2/ATP-dependent DNA helicase PcrA
MSREGQPERPDAPPIRRGVVVSGLGLDERQRAAVSAPPGPVLILAGAGSGKTRVLTERAAALARSPAVGAGRVLVITFTNRAAEELRRRLAALIGAHDSERMTVGTFHAVCHRLLRAHAGRIGRSPQFSVYDAQASRRLITIALQETGARDELDTRLVVEQIGRAKARLVGPDGYRRLARSERARRIAEAFAHYEHGLERADALDFDDLLVRGVELLGDEHRAAGCRERWRAVLVDEYQDTNPAQDEWLRRLAAKPPNLTVVGDPQQSIFGFRSAEVENILRFEARYPGTRVVALERNYRSSGAIVDAAGALAGCGGLGERVRMWTPSPSGAAVVAIACADERDEAEQAAAWCAALVERGAPHSEVAVLFRTRAQARLLEDGLLWAGVPSRMLGGQGLWESAAVRDLVSHLTLCSNPRDTVALARALRCQPGVGAVAVARVLGAAEDHDGDLLATCARAQAIRGLAGRQALAVEGFGRRLGERVEALPARGVAGTAIDTVLVSGLAERLRGERTERSEEQLEQLRRVCGAARRYERSAEAPTMTDFLSQVTLAGGEGEDADADVVTLATLHAAKGAEWDHVRLIGLSEGLLPHRRAIERGEADEERRLAYVGITRARRELVLTWPRTVRGQRTRMSRFVAEAGLTLAPAGAQGHTGGLRAA